MINDIKYFDKFEMDNSSLSILYVEDEKMIRDTIFKFLHRRFRKLYIAENGQEGLVLYHKYHPDIVITDIQMPVMSGLEMAKQIRKNNVQTPIIMTSAHNKSDVLLEAIEMNINSFLLKPIDITELLDRINRCSKKIQFNSFIRIFHLVAEQMSKGLMLISDVGKIQYVNSSFPNPSDFAPEEILSLSFVNDKERTLPFQIDSKTWQRLQNREKLSDTISIKGKSGETYYYYERCITPILNDANKITHFVLMSEDITKKQLEINALKDEVNYDSLTGLLRRSVFENSIDEIILNYDNFTCAMLDIDFFKSVNDEFGHDMGDKVLKQFSNIISSHLRNDDISFRWGGEEFLLLFKKSTIDEVFTILERIRQYIALEDFGIGHPLTVSIGLAEFRPEEAWTQTLKRADKALYVAKNRGRNQIQKDLL